MRQTFGRFPALSNLRLRCVFLITSKIQQPPQREQSKEA
jgi:hypothetical protein